MQMHLKQHCVVLYVPQGIAKESEQEDLEHLRCDDIHQLAKQGTSGILLFRQSPETKGM